MQCPRCERENRAGRRYCTGCGSALLLICTRCRAENATDDAFCGDCGTPLTVDRLQQLPNGAVAPEPAPPTPPGERRYLTVMFCDLADSSPVSEHLDPEDLREVLRAFQQTCAEVIDRYTGHIARFMGDGLLVYFGFPRAHDDDARRAVSAALELVEAVRALNDEIQARFGVTLSVRVGIHTGLVVLAEMGSGDRIERTDVVGETPAIADRLQTLAAADSVLISAATHRLIQGFFVCEPLGAQSLKGFVRPIEVFRVQRETGLDSRLDSGAALTPFVDRDGERAQLARAWQEARSGDMRVVLISGDPGVGKSRLVRVLREQLAAGPHTRVELRCSQLYQNSALYPLIDFWSRLFQFSEGDSPEAKAAKLETVITSYGLPAQEVLPLVAALLSLPLPAGYTMPVLSPELQKQRTVEAALAWLTEETARQPVILIIEDLHWIDPSTLDLLTLLIQQPRAIRVLVLLTYRPEFTPPWELGGYAGRISLERLTPEDAGQMVTAVAGDTPLPDDLREQIVDRADGVPLFIEELTKMVIEAGLIGETADVHGRAAIVPEPVIPETLHDSLMARLDRLAEAKEVAQIGATLGREFSYSLVKAVSGLSDAPLQMTLAQLVGAGLLYRRDVQAGTQYAFKHAMIQTAAYQSLLRSRRQQLHQTAAKMLEHGFPDIVATQPEVLAHHFTEAGLVREAIDYWHRGGMLAARHAGHAEAIKHYRRGLELIPGVSEEGEREQLELGLQIGLGYSAAACVGYATPEVEQAYGRAMTLAQRSGESPELFGILVGLWGFYFIRSDHAYALGLAEQMVRISQTAAEPILQLQAFSALSWSLFATGEFEAARRSAEESFRIDQSLRGMPKVLLGPQDSGVSSASLLSLLLMILGYPEQALRRHADCLTLMDEPDVWFPEFSRAAAANNLAWLHNLCEDPAAAAEQALQTIDLGMVHGFPNWQASGAMHLGMAKAAQGELTEGIALLSQGLDGWQMGGARVGLGFWLGGLARAHRRAGDLDAAAGALGKALDLAERTGESMYTAELYRLRGELTLARDPAAVGPAAEDLERALAIAASQKARLFELRAALGLHRLRTSEGDGDQTRRRLAEVYGWFTEGFDIADLREARELLDSRATAGR